MFKKLLLVTLFAGPQVVSAMNPIEEKVWNTYKKWGEYQLALDYQSAEKYEKLAIQELIEFDVSRCDRKFREWKLDQWLKEAKRAQATSLARILESMGAMDDRDGSKTRARMERSARREEEEKRRDAEREKRNKEERDAQPRIAAERAKEEQLARAILAQQQKPAGCACLIM